MHFKISPSPGEQHLYVIQILEQKKVIEKYVDLNSQSSQNEGYMRRTFKIFTYYLAMLGLSCCPWDLHCPMRDLSLRSTDSLVVAHGLSSHGAWA